MDTIPLSLDGYTDLPPGKIASVVTYLEMRAPAPVEAPPLAAGLTVRRLDAPDIHWYRALFRRIGENWLWSSLLVMPDAELAAFLSDPLVEVDVLERDGSIIGLAELDRRHAGEVEIVLFGVVPEAVGTGAAHQLMTETLRRAFAPDISRVWLHTCTFDHPGAVRFYLRAGFRAFKFAVEVMDDPRLIGLMPETASPNVPIVRPAASSA